MSSSDEFQRKLRREYYRIRGIPQEQLTMGLKDIFDAFEKGLDFAETGLSNVHVDGDEDKPKAKGRADEIEDAEIVEEPPPRRKVSTEEDWKSTWRDDVVWGVRHNVHHAIAMGQPVSVCQDVKTQDLTDRAKLEPGKVVNCCTSCVLGVSRRG